MLAGLIGRGEGSIDLGGGWSVVFLVCVQNVSCTKLPIIFAGGNDVCLVDCLLSWWAAQQTWTPESQST